MLFSVYKQSVNDIKSYLSMVSNINTKYEVRL